MEIQEVKSSFLLQHGMWARPQKKLPLNDIGLAIDEWCAANDHTVSRLAFKSGVTKEHLRTVSVSIKPLTKGLAGRLHSYMSVVSTSVPAVITNVLEDV